MTFYQYYMQCMQAKTHLITPKQSTALAAAIEKMQCKNIAALSIAQFYVQPLCVCLCVYV